MNQSMLFSDIKKKLVDANIFGKLKKKKIKFITDNSEEVNSNAPVSYTHLTLPTNREV